MTTQQLSWPQQVAAEYRAERARQEAELEAITGGYDTDYREHLARGGKPLITYKDWLIGLRGRSSHYATGPSS